MRRLRKMSLVKPFLGVLAFACLCVVAHGQEDSWTVAGAGRVGLKVMEGRRILFDIEPTIVGRGWARPRLDQLPTVEEGVRVYEQKGVDFSARAGNQQAGGQIDVRLEVCKAGDRAVEMVFRSTPREDTRYSYPNEGVGLAPFLPFSSHFRDGTCTVEYADGNSEEFPYPLPRGTHPDAVAVALRTADGKVVRFEFTPALFIHSDHNEIRMFARREEPTPAGQAMTQSVRMLLPAKVAFEPANRWVDMKDWFVFENTGDFAAGSVIGMEDWLEKPAGGHGWVQIDGDRFVFADGTPVKFFGTNISYSQMAVPQEQADQWNDKWAKHGVNLVRLHKFINHSWAGVMSEDHMVPDPDKIVLFDYYHASARKRGIYLGWSPVFHMRVTPADRERVKYYEEIVKGNWNRNVGADVIQLKNIAPDIQDLLIKETVALLERKNVHTGIRYADDPALAYIELHNEDDIFFPFDNYQRIEKTYPRYFADYQARFCAFLEKKYGSQEVLEKAWGGSYPRGRAIAERNIRPNYPSWAMSEKVDPYVADTLHFMYTEQLGFYRRFKQAIRDTGYGGAITGGCWQAATWLGHLLNTLTDYEVGFIDRHNYSGTPLDRPGAGNMSVAFQQVKDRPFNFSEWGGGGVAVPTVAVYGLGLQGWDASCQFSSNTPGLLNETPRSVNNSCDAFPQAGQYPALSRMVMRGDVREGEVVANRRVSIPRLLAGEVPFYEHFSMLGGGANTKEFSSVVPQSALMAGRVVLEYVDGPVDGDPVVENVDEFIDREHMQVRSNTGQLLWDYSGRGFFTVDTPGTQAVVGYIPGREVELGDVIFVTEQDAPLKLYVSSLEKDRPIASARRLLITAFARDANTGTVMDELDGRPLVSGTEPLLLEPVTARITLKGSRIASVQPLDHAGRVREGRAPLAPTRRPDGDVVTMDGKVTKAVYYLVEVER